MELLENVDTIISVICGATSIVMFLLAKKQKDECENIKNIITQKINVITENSSISSSDEFNINKVKTFDNRKSIK